MQLLGFLILFPLIVAIALFFIKNDDVRHVIVIAGAIIIALVSILCCLTGVMTGPMYFELESVALDFVGTLIGVAVAAVILYFGVTFKNKLAIGLACVQVALSLVFELGVAPQVTVVNGLYYDYLSLLLAFIIGVVGSAICVYALGYMKDFQAHQPEGTPDKRPFFFAIMFLFLSAMFLIVFSNNMVWMFTGWEVTTVCSFLLIGYTRTEEALTNAFRQINMNLAGGIGFVLALYACVFQAGTLDFEYFLVIGIQSPEIVVFAVTALSFAGLTKAAQMPFHTWLLGAMVAPTPTSALLHSSTMVKAGVFLLVKLAPVLLVCPVPATMLMIVGGFTFLMCSMLAISQSNAKRVLAYSTIANLGLITACAGVGTAEAVWAAMFLILFHAAAKSLLFLCVGTAEHHIGSRNIEDMDLLFERMPKLARFMMIGIMCMFIAPFGMLVAKWATLVSFVNAGCYILIMLLACGSAATFMFWAKWFGKLSGIAGDPENVELTIHKTEWVPLGVMLVLIFLCCGFIPFISAVIVEPQLYFYYGAYGMFVYGVYGLGGSISDDFSLWVMCILAVVVFLVILFGLTNKQKSRKVPVYMSGISIDNQQRTFRNSLTGESRATQRNWYMEDYFGEKKLTVPSQVFSGVFTAFLVIFAFVQSLI